LILLEISDEKDLESLLFRIISRMSQNSKEKATYFVHELQKNPINIRVHEFIIKDQKPNQLHKFAPAMFEDIARWIIIKYIFIEVLKVLI
jgi:hypothetical protein